MYKIVYKNSVAYKDSVGFRHPQVYSITHVFFFSIHKSAPSIGYSIGLDWRLHSPVAQVIYFCFIVILKLHFTLIKYRLVGLWLTGQKQLNEEGRKQAERVNAVAH